jgi:hypothetical protein
LLADEAVLISLIFAGAAVSGAVAQMGNTVELKAPSIFASDQ